MGRQYPAKPGKSDCLGLVPVDFGPGPSTKSIVDWRRQSAPGAMATTFLPTAMMLDWLAGQLAEAAEILERAPERGSSLQILIACHSLS